MGEWKGRVGRSFFYFFSRQAEVEALRRFKVHIILSIF